MKAGYTPWVEDVNSGQRAIQLCHALSADESVELVMGRGGEFGFRDGEHGRLSFSGMEFHNGHERLVAHRPRPMTGEPLDSHALSHVRTGLLKFVFMDGALRKMYFPVGRGVFWMNRRVLHVVTSDLFHLLYLLLCGLQFPIEAATNQTVQRDTGHNQKTLLPREMVQEEFGEWSEEESSYARAADGETNGEGSSLFEIIRYNHNGGKVNQSKADS